MRHCSPYTEKVQQHAATLMLALRISSHQRIAVNAQYLLCHQTHFAASINARMGIRLNDKQVQQVGLCGQVCRKPLHCPTMPTKHGIRHYRQRPLAIHPPNTHYLNQNRNHIQQSLPDRSVCVVYPSYCLLVSCRHNQLIHPLQKTPHCSS